MKTRIITVVLFVFVAFQAAGQVHFGVKAGVGKNRFYKSMQGLDYNNGIKDVLTFNGGAFAEISVSSVLFVKPSVLFATKGSRWETYLYSYSNETGYVMEEILGSFNLNYVEVPINILHKNYLGGGAFIVGMGPYLGYGISGKSKVTYQGETTIRNVEFTNTYGSENGKAYFKPLDFGFNALVGYEFRNGLLVNLDLKMSLTNIIPANPAFSSHKPSTKHFGFNLSVGYKF